MEYAHAHGAWGYHQFEKPTEVLSDEHRVIERVLAAVEKLLAAPPAPSWGVMIEEARDLSTSSLIGRAGGGGADLGRNGSYLVMRQLRTTASPRASRSAPRSSPRLRCSRRTSRRSRTSWA